MVKEDRLEKLREKMSEITRQQQAKQALLDKALSQRQAPPQVGDIFIHPKTIGFEWVTLCEDENDPKKFVVVLADDAPMVGSTDVELPVSALYSPLILRCDHILSICKIDFGKLQRVGILEEWHRLRALDKVKQISDKKFRITLQKGITKILKSLHRELPKRFYHYFGDITRLRSSVLHQEMNYDPDYVEWKGEVNKAWIAALPLMVSALPQESEQKNTGYPILTPYNFVYALGIAVVGFAIVIAWEVHIGHFDEKSSKTITISSMVSKPKFQAIQLTISNNLFKNEKQESLSHHSFSHKTQILTKPMQNFRDGVLYALQELRLLHLLPSTVVKENLVKKESFYFRLGQWTLNLEVLCQFASFQYEIPEELWDKQKQGFEQLESEFQPRWQLYDEAEEAELDTIEQTFGNIEPLLKQLPNSKKPEIYVKLGKQLKKMRMDF
jgi:hypothetical protein